MILKRLWFLVIPLAMVLGGSANATDVPDYSEPNVAGVANPADVTVHDLDTLVGKWMDLRAAIADEKRDWRIRSQQWKKEIELLRAEKGELAKKVERFNTSASAAKRDKSTVLASEATMEALLDALALLLDCAEADLRRWVPMIPKPLGEAIAEQFDALPATAEQARAIPVTERALKIIAIYSQIETMQHGFHATRETLDTGGGKRRQVDVLYLGLARGFAVSSDNQWAAIGTPTAQGWSWSVRPAMALRIRKALEVYNQEQTAQLVNLPLQVLEPHKEKAASVAEETGKENIR